MLRYKLRTLMIVLALGPPVLAVGWWKYSAWRAELERQRQRVTIRLCLTLDGTSMPPPAALRPKSQPPATPMQPGGVDVRKLTEPRE
jgi:hypothetical protein